MSTGTGAAFTRVLTELERVGSRVTWSGGDRVKATCPAHEDTNPSLVLTGIEGKALVHCHGPCSTTDVLSALGLTHRDLYDQPGGESYTYPGDRVVTKSVDRAGRKEFRQRNGSAPAELYRLDKVRAAVAAGEPVYMVEGEKDAHSLEHLGVVATTAPAGASNVARCDLSPLDGAHVVAVVDKDQAEAGWAHRLLVHLGERTAALTFVQAREGKDSADHVAAG